MKTNQLAGTELALSRMPNGVQFFIDYNPNLLEGRWFCRIGNQKKVRGSGNTAKQAIDKAIARYNRGEFYEQESQNTGTHSTGDYGSTPEVKHQTNPEMD